MSDYFVGEIRLFSFDYAPQDWHICDGSLLPIQGNQALFALLGTQFGGDGKTNFALPDFRGRVPVGITTNSTTMPPGATRYVTGNKGGTETVALTTTQAPIHNHTFKVNTTTGTALASNPPNYLSSSGPDNGEKVLHNVYSDFTAPGIPLKSDSISNTGSGAAHNNMQPSTVMNFCIATVGIFPSRN